ncbi:MAG: hypothetical protein RMN52_10465 [Anaerolineae bacterium]|nr:hypothetical protein [Candidatus Roseilinea sp.]MDW8450418.1 hypothetical protein [Anaerolineae bacterium]
MTRSNNLQDFVDDLNHNVEISKLNPKTLETIAGVVSRDEVALKRLEAYAHQRYTPPPITRSEVEKRLDEALNDLKTVSLIVEFNGKDTDSSKLIKGRNSADLEQVAEALMLLPFSAARHNNLGCVFMRLGECELAKEQFQEAIKRGKEEPGFAEAIANLERWNDIVALYKALEVAPS